MTNYTVGCPFLARAVCIPVLPGASSRSAHAGLQVSLGCSVAVCEDWWQQYSDSWIALSSAFQISNLQLLFDNTFLCVALFFNFWFPWFVSLNLCSLVDCFIVKKKKTFSGEREEAVIKWNKIIEIIRYIFIFKLDLLLKRHTWF